MSPTGYPAGQELMSLSKRFWLKVEKRGEYECWPWKASCNKDGYGQFWTGKTFTPAHRFALQDILEVPIGTTLVVCHSCDNPRCCNPSHLFVGCVSDNVRDKMRKGRHNNQYTKRAKTLCQDAE